MSHHHHARRKHGHSGWGLSEHLYNPECLLLFNFDIDSAQLKLEHKEDLRQLIVPPLKFHHGVAVVGLTSRTGTTAHNQELSLRRAQNTLAFLKSEAGSEFDARKAIGFGEMKAKEEGYRPNGEDPRFTVGGGPARRTTRGALPPELCSTSHPNSQATFRRAGSISSSRRASTS